MHRRAFALAAPLAAIGCLAGHALGYAVVDTHARTEAAHGYLAWAPLLLAVCLVAAAAAFLLRVTGRLAGHPPAWILAATPALAFLLQELVERLVAGFPAHAVLEPAVLVGLTAQIPMGVVAVLAARLLLACADAVGRRLRTHRVVRPRPAPVLAPTAGVPLVAAALPFDRLGRAPPR